MKKYSFSQQFIEWSELINGDHQEFLGLELFDEDQSTDREDFPENFEEGDISISYGCKRIKVSLRDQSVVTWHDGFDDDMVEGEGPVVVSKFEHIYKTDALIHECRALKNAGYNSEIGVTFWACMLLFGPEIKISYMKSSDHYLCNPEAELAKFQLEEFASMLNICRGSDCVCAETAEEYQGYITP